MSEGLFPPVTDRPSVFINSHGPEVFGTACRAKVNSFPATAVYNAAQRAFYIPFRLTSREVIKRFFWVNGTTAGTDNVQVGVYNNAGTAIKIGTSTTASGVSALQFDDISDLVLLPGAYYMALWCSGTTTHIMRTVPAIRLCGRPLGIYQESSLASGLQSAAVFAQVTQGYLPVFGLTRRATP